MSDIMNKMMYNTPCIKDCSFSFIVRPCDPGNGNIRVVMLEISEEEEHLLDSGKSLSLTRGRLSFVVNPALCLAYGDFDLSPNSEDLNKFYDAHWFDRFYIKHFIPSEYDYNTHTLTSDLRRGRWFDTRNIKVYLPYLHACMNKPKRIVIFKEYNDLLALRRAEKHNEQVKQWNKDNKEYLKKKAREKSKAKRELKLSKLTFNYKK